MANSPLQKAPRGLLELFRLRTLGRQPDQFEQTVQPVVDVTNMYGTDLAYTGEEIGAAGAFPRTTTETFTDGPHRLLALNGQLTTGAIAPTNVFGIISIRFAPNAPLVVVGHIGPFTGLAARGYFVTGILTEPILMPAGAAIQTLWQGTAGGADHVASLTYAIQTLTSGASS